MLTICVLGPATVRRDDEPIKVPAGKTCELLVRLSLEPGAVVRSERLLEELWAEDAARTRANTLQSKVAKLRRALGSVDSIETVDGGYRLSVAPDQVDASLVLDETDAARRLLDEAEHRQVTEICAAALARFNGELLLSAGTGTWVDPYRARLEEAKLQLVEMRCTALLRTGESSEVIGELEPFLADHPFQERLWAIYITALYQAGRQAAALDAYKRIRTTLADELGLDPGRELRELERQILDHDERLAAPPATLDVRPWDGNVPALGVRLVGRDDETSNVVELVSTRRLVEVIGPGGVGKTALALDVARRVTQPGGVWFIRLEGANTSSEVIDSTVAALGVVGGESALIERLKTASALLIMDNCEHVLGPVADWVTRLLDTVAGLRIVSTSQAPLDLDGSTTFELAPLGIDDAVELFTERATARREQTAGPDGDEELRTLCRALDGLPLAIELAAARTRTLSVGEITERLDDRFAVLNDPTSRRPERRRALRATIAWSYDLLFPDDKRGLWAVATFAGGASLPAVEFVLGALGVPHQTTIDVLGRLASRSLLTADPGALGTRYRLLDSIRAFALDAMQDAASTTVAHDAHAQWFAEAAQGSTAGVRSANQAEHLAFAADERANIDAALTWTLAHDPPRALDIAAGFGWAWVVLGDSRGAQRILTAIEAAGGSADPRLQASALLLAGWIEAATGHLEPARRHVLEATARAEAINDIELQARAAYYLAYVVSHHGDFIDGLALTDKSRELYANLDHPWDQAANGLFATRAAISAADEARSVQAAEDVQRLLDIVDDPWLHVRGDAMLGELARLQHRFDDAVEHIDRAAATSNRLGFRQTEAYQLASLGRAHCQAGNYETGADTIAQAVSNAEAIGDVRMAALARVHLGRVLRALGRVDEARRALDLATRWHHDAGGGEQALLGECLLAAIDAAATHNDEEDPSQRLERFLQDARVAGNSPVEVFALDALARTAAMRGDSTTASALLDNADTRMRTASHFIAERDRVDATVARNIVS